jgi:squalene-hopene/tetraprenyl-beta-curcumene cyclase
MSSWTRGIVGADGILSALRRISVCRNMRGWTSCLRTRAPHGGFWWSDQLLVVAKFLLALDRALKLYEKLPWKPLRQAGLREAKSWLLEHIERTEGLAAIYPR